MLALMLCYYVTDMGKVGYSPESHLFGFVVLFGLVWFLSQDLTVAQAALKLTG